MRVRSNKGLRQVVAAYPEWSAAMTRGGHWKLTSPSGEVVFTGASPSDFRALKNLRARLRRVGLSKGENAQ